MEVKTGHTLKRHEIKEVCYQKAKLTSCRSKQRVESFRDILTRQKKYIYFRKMSPRGHFIPSPCVLLSEV